MLRFHLFTIGWAYIADYGSPDDPEEFKTLLAYSPYHNVRSGTMYPATLLITGDHDDRVFPAHSFKFAAALQAAQGGPNPILLHVQRNAGHGEETPTLRLIQQWVMIPAFCIQTLELEFPRIGALDPLQLEE